MTPMDQLKVMLTGNKRGKPAPDAKEEARERRAGKKSTPREEALEDPKGKPLFLRKKGR